MLKLLLVAAGSTLGAGAAHAQAAPAAPPTGMGVGLSSESAVTRPGGDNSDRDASMRRDEALDKAFLSGAEARGLVQLKGHRSVGGMRASIYNAMPVEGVQALVAYMKEFEAQHG